VKKKVTLGQVFLQLIRFSPVSIISAMFHTHHLHVFLTRRTYERSLGTFQKAFFFFGNRGSLDRKVLRLFRLDMANHTSTHNTCRFSSRLTVLPSNMSIPIIPDHGCHAASYSEAGLPFCHAICLFQWYLTMVAKLLHIQKVQCSILGS
jgi:hypothetical protein